MIVIVPLLMIKLPQQPHQIHPKIPPTRKYYLCFQTEGKTDRESKCAKSRALTKFSETIFEIDSF